MQYFLDILEEMGASGSFFAVKLQQYSYNAEIQSSVLGKLLFVFDSVKQLKNYIKAF